MNQGSMKKVFSGTHLRESSTNTISKALSSNNPLIYRDINYKKASQEQMELISEQTAIPEQELKKLISKEFGKGELPRFMKLADIRYANDLIKGMTEESKELFNALDPQLERRAKDTFRLLIYNLVVCTFTRSRLSLPGSKEAYDKGTYYRELHFTRNSVKAALKALDKYLIRKPGNTFTKEVDSYEPNQLFQLKLIPLLYSVYEEYTDDTELIVIQNKDNKEFIKIVYSGSKLESIQDKHIMRVNPPFDIERTYQDDLEQLIKINDALKDASYALKAPVKRIYSRGHVMTGGRLYTPLANLPDRKARIRINTLLNGNPVAEVDLKANHSSMLYALKGKQLPRDFYDLIAKESGQARDKVKWLVIKMIGAKERAITLAAKVDEEDYFKSKFVMTKKERGLIEAAIQRQFPDLCTEFYNDIGVVLQAMEGDILLDAMCELVDRGIVSLPIHDALYVEQANIGEAENALKKAWANNLGVNFEPFVDVDTP